MGLPTDSQERKDIPVWSGCIAYFPDAIVAIAMLSQASNIKHNGPGAPLQWAKEKSTDEEDAGLRHGIEPLLVGGSQYDPSDGFAHKVKKAWRACAELQRFLEEGNAARAFIPNVTPCGGAVEIGGNRYPCTLKAVHGGPCQYEEYRHVLTDNTDGPICTECGRNVQVSDHAVNCSSNFAKRVRAPSICSDCGVDLENDVHDRGCLRLNQPFV